MVAAGWVEFEMSDELVVDEDVGVLFVDDDVGVLAAVFDSDVDGVAVVVDAAGGGDFGAEVL